MSKEKKEEGKAVYFLIDLFDNIEYNLIKLIGRYV